MARRDRGDIAAIGGTRSLNSATALLFSFGCGVTSGVLWDYVISMLL
jgi:hypothetical protein